MKSLNWAKYIMFVLAGVLVALCGAAAGGCVAAPYEEGYFICTKDCECPPDWFCHDDGLCYSEEQDAGVDGGADAGGDAGEDAGRECLYIY